MSKKDDARERREKRKGRREKLEKKFWKSNQKAILDSMSLSPFDPYVRMARIIKTIDGDTVRAEIDSGLDHFSHLFFEIDNGFNNFFRVNIRLLEIDTAELRDKNPEMKELAYKAKEFAYKWNDEAKAMLPKDDYYLTIESRKDDSFGRWLGFIKNAEGESLGEALLEAGLAEVYEK